MFCTRAMAKTFTFDSRRGSWFRWIRVSGSLYLFWITISQMFLQWSQIYLFCMTSSLQSCLFNSIFISHLIWPRQMHWKGVRIHLVHSSATHPAACIEFLKQRWYFTILTAARFRPPGKISLLPPHFYCIVTQDSLWTLCTYMLFFNSSHFLFCIQQNV